ncbi:hypothetical protein MM213_13335 [Belliella sp. R4-6]|uniref:PAP2 superfamily protein n=1 Tax=Belliella alkalica TaxID=1730871 RepID=A0ABS9VDH0_9BACT|nr:hypothetical protein [Belliella alkalica]MCH7414476.1 hypothetical protein [Belliella alkalica]
MMRKLNIAKTISIIGHPLMIGTMYVIFISFHDLEKETAMIISASILSIVTFPIIIHNWIKTRNGSYSNFDVSNQQQRRSFYPFSILLFLICLIFFYILKFPDVVILTTLSFLMMLISMSLVNLKVKASLHLAIAMFISAKLFGVAIYLGVFFLIFSVLIAWSRKYLGRHSLQELTIGSMNGLLFGILSGYF